MERLCRYVTRPPIAQDRLSRRADGALQLELRNPWKDGTRAPVLSPDDLLVRLCAAVPPPRFHLVRYFGVLSSHSALRSQVVPQHPHQDCAHRPPPAAGDQLKLLGEFDGGSAKGSRHRWAWLLAPGCFWPTLSTAPSAPGPMRARRSGEDSRGGRSPDGAARPCSEAAAEARLLPRSSSCGFLSTPDLLAGRDPCSALLRANATPRCVRAPRSLPAAN